ncbi:hypothetical protein D9611_013411 [Ephemerocybe angulata]|uniref:Uncharacterized protein n=1 Tax=Ephemerocybe angulata TaxID=980116 RepID=A0A8H5BV36_9AGAR|nr:hypothetical protein D9611_013411 [Tulosesus angulatus]
MLCSDYPLKMSRPPDTPTNRPTPPYDEVTPEGMLTLMKFNKTEYPDQFEGSNATSRSQEMSTAVMMAAMFNGMRLKDPDDDDGGLPYTLYPDE